MVLQIVGVALGLLYLWLEYRASILLWVVGLLMPLVHGVLYYRSGLYADAAMNGYYILAGVYGLVFWSRRSKRRFPIAHTPLRLVPTLTVVGIAVFFAIHFVLVRFTDSTVPVWDALTTAASVVAMWMLSRKMVEQWLVWLAVDVVTCGLYIYKDIPLTAGLYGLYSVLAVMGYLRWKKLVIRNS